MVEERGVNGRRDLERRLIIDLTCMCNIIVCTYNSVCNCANELMVPVWWTYNNIYKIRIVYWWAEIRKKVYEVIVVFSNVNNDIIHCLLPPPIKYTLLVLGRHLDISNVLLNQIHDYVA